MNVIFIVLYLFNDFGCNPINTLSYLSLYHRQNQSTHMPLEKPFVQLDWHFYFTWRFAVLGVECRRLHEWSAHERVGSLVKSKFILNAEPIIMKYSMQKEYTPITCYNSWSSDHNSCLVQLYSTQKHIFSIEFSSSMLWCSRPVGNI